MIGKFIKGNTAVFIDSSNIYFSQKTIGWRIDFKRLLEYFKQETKLSRIAFYGAINPENEKEKKFHDFLEIIGYVVRHKKIKFIKDENEGDFGGHHKGNIDVDLTIDAVHLRDSYDSFVLLSGDGDFESLIKYLKGFKKRCVVISTKGSVSIELLRQAKFIDFKKIRNQIELKNKNSSAFSRRGKPGSVSP
ncbi:MAG TPA: NYN domain-containing protein [Candidatus Atribacteria bacterium]|nr:NYN domain-containing protein [Candidatus Atribacteria bacterium]